MTSIEMQSYFVRYLKLVFILILKLIWIQELQSERQINDIDSLLENETVDHDYIHYWCQKLDLQTFNIL